MNWKFCSRTCFWKLEPFFIMANANSLFLSTLAKPETLIWGGGSVLLCCALGCILKRGPLFMMTNANFVFLLSNSVSNWWGGFIGVRFSIIGELQPFSFFIRANKNFLFPLTFGKTQTFGEGSVIWHIFEWLEPLFHFSVNTFMSDDLSGHNELMQIFHWFSFPCHHASLTFKHGYT